MGYKFSKNGWRDMTSRDTKEGSTQTLSAPQSAPISGMSLSSGDPTNPLTVLGQRLRDARHKRGMSQDQVAKPEFTKSYVSAVERGKARPSLKALELMSRRLGVSSSDLLNMVSLPEVAGQDPRSRQEEIAYQLDCVRRAVDTGQPSEGLRLLAALEQNAAADLPLSIPDVRFRLHYLRALAHLRLDDAAQAHKALAQALPLAEALPDGGENVERIHNLTGGAYYQQNLPALARDEHQRGLAAIQSGVVKDLNLRLLIYSNLANDYWALGEADQAVATYREALTLLNDVNNLEQQSALYWNLGAAYREVGNLEGAKLAAGRALGIYEGAQNMSATAQMSLNLAEILAEKQDYAGAEQALAQAQAVLEGSGNRSFLSALHQQYALMELNRKQVDAAATHTTQALELGEAAYQQQVALDDSAARTSTLRTYLRALRTAGRVAEAQGDPARADRSFQQAIQLAGDNAHQATATELAQSYAEVLAARGQHEQANLYYRQALQHRPPGARH